MGAFGAIIGFVSSKTVFFVGITIVALAIVTLFAREMHGGRQMTNRMKYHTMAMAGAALDSDPAQMRANIISLLANNSLDPNMTSANIDQIIHEVAGDQQEGGPLNELARERREGRINSNEHRMKMLTYIKELAAKHSVPLRELKVRIEQPEV